MTAVLVGVAHGSRDPAAQETVRALLGAVRERRPDLDVRVAFVQNAAPDLPSVLAGAGPGAVVVPLLLSRGYHVAVDIGRATADAGAAVARPLGPDAALASALDDRLTEAGARRHAPAVLAAAGSSDPDAVEDVEAQARLLGARRGGPVVAAYATGRSPTVDEAVTALLAEHAAPVAVAPYLLAPGHFARVIAGTAATWSPDRSGCTRPSPTS